MSIGGRARVALAIVLVAVLSGLVMVRAGAERPSRCDRFAAAAADRRAHDLGPSDGDRIVVVGDSYSVGLGLVDPDAAWPARLPGRVQVDGFSGSGFGADSSPCGRVSYADRAPRAARAGADLVVVEGGLNDVDQTDAAILSGFRRLIAAIDGAPVLVVGPTAAPSRAAGAAHVDRLLRRIASRTGVRYLSMLDLPLTYLDDDLHLTPSGHRVFGDRVASAVERIQDRAAAL